MAKQGLAIQYSQSRHWIALALWLIVISSVCIVSWFGYRYFTTGDLPVAISVSALAVNPSVDESPITDSQLKGYSVAADEPRYVSIPSLGVTKQRILKTGVDANNQLAFAANIHDTGWYQKSAKIGQGYGVVLLIGHNKGANTSGAFAKISTLKSDSKITVERGDGFTQTYLVQDTKTMTVEDASKIGMKTMLEPLDEVHEGLTLVTTDGNWVPRLKQFERRTIVRAVAAE